MTRTVPRPRTALVSSFACLLLATAPGASAQPAVTVTGEYFCVTGGTCPCQSDGNLKLTGDGRWYWGSHTGRWQADTTRVSFDGLGGAAALGPAAIGAGTLTFHSSGNQVVCWQPRPGVARPGSPD